MPRMLDLECSKCGEEVDDFYVTSTPPRLRHLYRTNGTYCGGRFETVFRMRPRNAQWSDRDAVVVFRRPDGSYSYPGHNTAATPAGCERVVMRSMREVQQFERQQGVVSHIAHYDQGSGRSADDIPPAKRGPDERERYERFREYTRGIF